MAIKKRLIDAEPIKKFIVDGLNNPDLKKAFGHDAIEILAEIEYAPTVDAVEVVHGRWIDRTKNVNGYADYRYDCSVCEHIFWLAGIGGLNYCPNCGAKMGGVTDESDS